MTSMVFFITKLVLSIVQKGFLGLKKSYKFLVYLMHL
ncbi:hypothetical protein Gotri_007994 [Gossypium trilobum]|uniref:Uncharacterized protein n=1 Tax=Gossypium trilobum TaxID=34281 RepID=A0A7J9EHY6_9ROSI|nr:hypothetical protein [Gossypium trilobum]